MSEPDVETPVLDRYECRACGYVYEPEKGDDKHDIPSGTLFAELPINWRCPVCTAKKTAFANIGPAGTASGFKENLGYGLGVSWLLVFYQSLRLTMTALKQFKIQNEKPRI